MEREPDIKVEFKEPGLTIELDLKPDVTTQDIKNWLVWESARIRKGESYPSLIYVAMLDFLFAGKHITAKEALRHKTTLGQVVSRRRHKLKLNTMQMARVARITHPQVGKIEKGMASISAYGSILLALESYALSQSFADAIENMSHLVSHKPEIRRGAPNVSAAA